MAVTLTIDQGNAIGKKIMADARCTLDVKEDVMRGLSRPQPDKTYIYTPNSDCGRKDEWYDLMFVSAAE